MPAAVCVLVRGGISDPRSPSLLCGYEPFQPVLPEPATLLRLEALRTAPIRDARPSAKTNK